MPGAGNEMQTGKIARYARQIAAAYPELGGADLRMVDEEGQYNDTLIVNERLIFRFPRYQEGVEMVRREVSFLRALAGRTTLPVPEPSFASLEGESPGDVFMGYPLLAGEPLWRQAIFAESDENVLELWSQQLAGFLKALHALPVADFGSEWPVSEAMSEWEKMYADIRTHLFPLMRRDARDQVADHFEAYFSNPAVHKFSPAPRHGDYGSGNILYDPATKMITGIIDFGYAGIGDPALDVAAASTLGETIFSGFASTYPAIKRMMPRVHFYRGTFALFEALHGFKSGDNAAFKAGMATYV